MNEECKLTPRDPKRIDRIIQKLAIIWRGVPDLRLFQLLETIKYSIDDKIDPFYIEDDRVEKAIDEEIERRNMGELGETSGT